MVVENCKSTAVSIRTIGTAIINNKTQGHKEWPNIPDTTLLFSDSDNYLTKKELDEKEHSTYDNFRSSVKPNYG